VGYVIASYLLVLGSLGLYALYLVRVRRALRKSPSGAEKIEPR
jgi:hypothetical protein